MNIFSIIGGDLRIVNLANMLNRDGNKIYSYGLENADTLLKDITRCESLNAAIENTNVIITSIPLSKDGKVINAIFSNYHIEIEHLIDYAKNKVIITGSISEDIKNRFELKGNRVIDILGKEELAVMNSIPTAEGAIKIAIEETKYTLNGSKILILGFGRIGKILAKMLSGFGAKIYCEARKKSDMAWIKAYGYNLVELCNLENGLGYYDIIFNTIPFIVLNREKLKKLKKDSLIIDLASNPGGVDEKEVKNIKIKYIKALALPGKVAPLTSASYIEETLYNILEEMEK